MSASKRTGRAAPRREAGRRKHPRATTWLAAMQQASGHGAQFIRISVDGDDGRTAPHANPGFSAWMSSGCAECPVNPRSTLSPGRCRYAADALLTAPHTFFRLLAGGRDAGGRRQVLRPCDVTQRDWSLWRITARPLFGRPRKDPERPAPSSRARPPSADRCGFFTSSVVAERAVSPASRRLPSSMNSFDLPESRCPLIGDADVQASVFA